EEARGRIDVVPATEIVGRELELCRDVFDRVTDLHAVKDALSIGIDEDVLGDDDDRWSGEGCLLRIGRLVRRDIALGEQKNHPTTDDLALGDPVQLHDLRDRDLARLRNLFERLAETNDVALQARLVLLDACEIRRATGRFALRHSYDP